MLDRLACRRNRSVTSSRAEANAPTNSSPELRACQRRRKPPESGSGLGARTGAAPVLQADSTTQSASSFRARIFSMVSRPSPSTSGDGGRGQRQRRLRQSVEFARHQPMSRKIDDAIVRQISGLDRVLIRRPCRDASTLAGSSLKCLCDGYELVGGVGQSRQLREVGAVDPLPSAALERRRKGTPRIAVEASAT